MNEEMSEKEMQNVVTVEADEYKVAAQRHRLTKRQD